MRFLLVSFLPDFILTICPPIPDAVTAPVPVHLVNLAWPEQNSEFTIVLVNNMEMNGVLYNGISTLFKGCKIFEYHDGMYSARVVSKTNIEVNYPSTAPGYLHEFGQV
jgi:hypothetical protein